MIKLKKLLGISVVLAGLLAAVPIQAIIPYDDVLVQQGIKNLEEGNLEEALADLTEAWRQGTRTPDKAYYLGMVYRRLLDYLKAREYLEEAVRLKPSFWEARQLLADTLLALERPDLALPHLQALKEARYQPPQTAMLLGLAAAKQKRYAEALDCFHQAEADPALAPEAKLQAGLVLAAQNRLKEARQVLKETVNLAPQTTTAVYAARYGAAVERRLEEVRPFRFNAYVGFEYDSNVTLQPGGATEAQLVSGRGDASYYHSGYLEYNFFAGRPFGLIASYAFYQNFHRRLTAYDLVSHTVGLSPTYQFENSRLWLPFSFNFTDLQNDKYYTAYVAAPTYLYLVTPKVGFELGGKLARKYYWFPVAFPQDDRSARNLGGSLGLYYFIKEQQGYLQARFSYEHDFAGGSNWESSSYRLYLMGLYPATSRLKLSAFLDLILQPYNHRFFYGFPPVYGPKRQDKTIIVGGNLAYNIYQGLEANLHYYYVRDNSNIPLYDYDRHIVGIQVGYQY